MHCQGQTEIFNYYLFFGYCLIDHSLIKMIVWRSSNAFCSTVLLLPVRLGRNFEASDTEEWRTMPPYRSGSSQEPYSNNLKSFSKHFDGYLSFLSLMSRSNFKVISIAIYLDEHSWWYSSRLSNRLVVEIFLKRGGWWVVGTFLYNLKKNLYHIGQYKIFSLKQQQLRSK